MLDILGSFIKPLILLVSYMSNGNSFPKPLTIEEERHYLKLYKEGDDSAKDKLIEHNMRLVAHIAKKYENSVRDSDDLISIGAIGLIKGISSFDENKASRLSTYVARCIENEFLMLLRSSKKSNNDISLNDSIGTDKEGNQILLIDIMSSNDEEIFDEVDLKMNVKQLYKNIETELDERERFIIKLRYGLTGEKCKTQNEIAKMLNISRSYISRLEKKALSKLSKGIER